MAYQSLYRTWRPRKFSEMVGQEAIVRALSNQAAAKRVAHAYLFCGSRGTGKTSAARIMAMAINCLHPQQGNPCLECANCKALMSETTLDVYEMDAASNSRVEEIREMLSRTDYPPQFVPYKVYIIDEVHMLSNAAFNALLKTLEEPPEYMVFILATTEPQKLPATILSRCQRYDFGRISEHEIMGRMKMALTEGLTADEGALALIAATAQGSMRDAWSLMDMCLGTESHLSEAGVREALGAVSQQFLFDFLDALLAGDTAGALNLADDLIRLGRDVPVFLREFNAHLRQVLAVKWTGAATRSSSKEHLSRLQSQAAEAKSDRLVFILEKCMLAEQDARWSSSLVAVLELFALRCTQSQPENGSPANPARLRAEKEARPQSAGQREPPVQPGAPMIAGDKEAIPAATSSNPEGDSPPVLDILPPVPVDELGQGMHGEGRKPMPLPLEGAQFPPAVDKPAGKAEQALAALSRTPKDAWNNMLKRLTRENPGLHAMLTRGRYGGYEDGAFSLVLEGENEFFASLLNDASRSDPISLVLSEEMGTPVRFRASGPQAATAQAVDEQDEHLEALVREFGRDKIVVKREQG